MPCGRIDFIRMRKRDIDFGSGMGEDFGMAPPPTARKKSTSQAQSTRPRKKSATPKPAAGKKASPRGGKRPGVAAGPRIRRILVPIDFSRTSLRCLRCACRYAEFYRATLILVHVNPVVLSPQMGHALSRDENKLLHDKVQQQLQAVHSKERRIELPVETVVSTGIPYREINSIAADRQADLIILSTHGHTGLRHVMLGSTAERVVREAPCPVLTIHQRLLEKRQPRVAPEQIRGILVPMDFSPPSRATLRLAVQFARQFKAGLELLHVTETLVYPEYPEFGHMDVQLLSDQLAESAQKKLETIRKRYAKSGVVRSTTVCEGMPFKEITAYAERGKIDLIIISTRGHSGLFGALLGSTSERVVQYAACPVLVIPQK